MTIVVNEDRSLVINCYDRAYDISNKIEWEVNSRVVSNQSCITQNWANLKENGPYGIGNTIICRVKQHPGTPTWQEITGFVHTEEDFEFKTW